MRFASYKIEGQSVYGLVQEASMLEPPDEFRARFPDLRSVLQAGALAEARQAAQDGVQHAFDAVAFEPVIPHPGKILCVGANYLTHMKEMGRRLVRIGNRVEIETFEVPDPGPGQLLVRVSRSQISGGSESRGFQPGNKRPIPVGYTTVGRIQAGVRGIEYPVSVVVIILCLIQTTVTILVDVTHIHG